MQRSLLLASAVCLSLCTARAAWAQRQILTVDPAASQIHFTLDGSAHTTHGTFHVQDGSIAFDPHEPVLSGRVSVSAASGDTGSGARDNKMKTEVLDVVHFADVTFEPSRYQGQLHLAGDSTIEATGIFTLHGTPHDLTIPMQVHIESGLCTVTARFPVPYVQWGLKDPSAFVLRVAKEVDVELVLKGSLSGR